MPSPAATAVAMQLRILGPLSAGELVERARISPMALSRAARELGPELLATGRTRTRRYGLRRAIAGAPAELPLFDLAAPGVRRVGALIPVFSGGFFVDAPPPLGGFHPDLPWFLHDLRPAGFLGRLAPRQHPELRLPPDIHEWSGDDVVRWLQEWGVNASGSMVLGEAALRRALGPSLLPAAPYGERAALYPQLAESTAALGIPGSSAAGEQPKFLAVRVDLLRRVEVLVKYSPPDTGPAARRTADLLRCEAHALRIVAEAGLLAAPAQIVSGGGRSFLEVERFDRGDAGRRGLVSLTAVAAHHGASVDSWGAAAADLQRAGVLSAADQERVVWLDRFGELIGNSDRHAGNLSFFFDEGVVGALAPVYDMLPMRYAVRDGEFRTPPLELPIPLPDRVSVWRSVWSAATSFWARVAADEALHPELRAVAAENETRLRAESGRVERLVG
jgi:hypothetical protein